MSPEKGLLFLHISPLPILGVVIPCFAELMTFNPPLFLTWLFVDHARAGLPLLVARLFALQPGRNVAVCSVFSSKSIWFTKLYGSISNNYFATMVWVFMFMFIIPRFYNGIFIFSCRYH